MASEAGSGRGAMIPRRTERAARRTSRAASRTHRMVMLRIGFGFLTSPPVVELAITAVIGLAALVGLGRENEARSVARLAAWDKAQTLRREGAAKIRSA
jgi:hypothetical protein